jgi:TRAP-type transport system small permease protein
MLLPESDATPQGEQPADWGLWIDRVLGLVAAVLLFGLMMLTAVDVVSRYIFNWPLRGSFELTELGLLVLIFAGLPLASRRGEHVTLDFIDRPLGPRAADVWRRVVEALVGLLVLGLAYQIWIKAGKIAGYGDVTDVLRVPVGPFVYLMCALIAITGVIHLVRAVLPSPAPPPLIPELDGKKSAS